tara:strand:+ start:135 stop:848 length:714 start_codon:yes stop_codon:yes gene_type:complete
MSHSADTDSQSFWLEHLGNAEALNRWVFSQFAGCLGDDILEVGCGSGNFTVMMGETGARVYGIEIEPSFVKAARQATEHQPTVRIEQADVTAQQWQQQFDTVVMLDVIEHLEDDVGILDVLHEALRPGGRIVLKAPAMPGVYGTLDEAVGHFRRYTRRTLSQVLSDAGFIDARVHAFNALGVLGWWLNGRLLRRRVPDAGFISGFNAVVPLARALDRVAPPGFGLSLIGLAERRNDA